MSIDETTAVNQRSDGDDQPPRWQTMLTTSVMDAEFHGLVLSRPRQKSDPVRRIDIRPIMLRDTLHWQITETRGTQQFHSNHLPPTAWEQILPTIGTQFRDVLVNTAEGGTQFRFNKKEVPRIIPVDRPSSPTAPRNHDRTPNYLLPEGRPIPFLCRLGIMNQAGQVRSRYRRKFRQINHFAELLLPVLRQLKSNGPLRVVDFGCGRSYLTFAVHYLVTSVLDRPAEIIGLDRNPGIIRECSEIASSLQLAGLTFRTSDIAEAPITPPVDLMISLHACDTATDDALLQAVRWEARAILCVPCCQHEMSATDEMNRLPGISRHGILRERFASLWTDTVRAELLEAVGYRTDIIEFIDTEHTPKNLLIRALRHEQQSIQTPTKKEASVDSTPPTQELPPCDNGTSPSKPTAEDQTPPPENYNAEGPRRIFPVLQFERQLKLRGLLPEDYAPPITLPGI